MKLDSRPESPIFGRVPFTCRSIEVGNFVLRQLFGCHLFSFCVPTAFLCHYVRKLLFAGSWNFLISVGLWQVV